MHKKYSFHQWQKQPKKTKYSTIRTQMYARSANISARKYVCNISLLYLQSTSKITSASLNNDRTNDLTFCRRGKNIFSLEQAEKSEYSTWAEKKCAYIKKNAINTTVHSFNRNAIRCKLSKNIYKNISSLNLTVK